MPNPANNLDGLRDVQFRRAKTHCTASFCGRETTSTARWEAEIRGKYGRYGFFVPGYVNLLTHDSIRIRKLPQMLITTQIEASARKSWGRHDLFPQLQTTGDFAFFAAQSYCLQHSVFVRQI